MKSLIAVSVLLFGTIGHVVAQQANFNWARKIGGTSDERGNSVTVDKNGNIFITGSFQGLSDFNPNTENLERTSAGKDDVFIEKLDPNGNLIWVKTFGGLQDDRGRSIKTDIDGNVYVGGSFTGKVDFDPGPSTFEITGRDPVDNFIIKLNSSGDFIWAKSFGGFIINALAIDNSGNIYACDNEIRKVSPSGDLLWSLLQRATGLIGVAENYSIEVDSSGDIYVTGRFNGTIDFDPSSSEVKLTSAKSPVFDTFSDDDIFVAKYDNSGRLLWVKQMGGGDRDSGKDLAVDDSRNVYVTGGYHKTADFDPGAGTYYLQNPGAYIQKLDASGNFKWAKGIGSASGSAIEVDKNGNVYVAGSFSQTVELASGLTLTNDGSSDQFILTLDNSGKYLWATSTKGQEYTGPGSMALNSSGEVYTVGTFYQDCQFDFQAETGSLTSAGQGDVFISKLSATGMPVRPPNTAPIITAYSGSMVIEKGSAFELRLEDFTIQDADNTVPNDFTLIILAGENYAFSGKTVTPAKDFSGKLTINVKVNDGKDDSAPFEFSITVNEIIMSTAEGTAGFEIYPNPSKDFVFLKGPEPLKEIIIYNENGKKTAVQRLTSDKLDISGFPPGAYFLNVSTINGDMLFYRLIVK